MTALAKIEGIGDKFAKKLNEVKIITIEDLLKMGATVKGRDELAEKTGITHKLLLEWINRADLFRIKGIGEEYSDLLEAAGVDTVPELAQRSAANLYKKMVEVNAAKKLVRQLPGEKSIQDWIDQAKALPRAVNY